MEDKGREQRGLNGQLRIPRCALLVSHKALPCICSKHSEPPGNEMRNGKLRKKKRQRGMRRGVSGQSPKRGVAMLCPPSHFLLLRFPLLILTESRKVISASQRLTLQCTILESAARPEQLGCLGKEESLHQCSYVPPSYATKHTQQRWPEAPRSDIQQWGLILDICTMVDAVRLECAIMVDLQLIAICSRAGFIRDGWSNWVLIQRLPWINLGCTTAVGLNAWKSSGHWGRFEGVVKEVVAGGADGVLIDVIISKLVWNVSFLLLPLQVPVFLGSSSLSSPPMKFTCVRLSRLCMGIWVNGHRIWACIGLRLYASWATLSACVGVLQEVYIAPA